MLYTNYVIMLTKASLTSLKAQNFGKNVFTSEESKWSVGAGSGEGLLSHFDIFCSLNI